MVVDGAFSNFLRRIFQETRHFRHFSLHRKREIQSGSRHLDTLNLAVGTSNFTCCQRNHIFGDRVVPCDRGITRTILEGMIKAKVQHYFKLRTDNEGGFVCMSYELVAASRVNTGESQSESLDSFKTSLLWNENEYRVG